jgi:hypothetical protein
MWPCAVVTFIITYVDITWMYLYIPLIPLQLPNNLIFFSGLANFARLGPQTTITLVVCEKLRELMGMNAI